MARTTEAAVKAIFEIDEIFTMSLTPYIEAANALLTAAMTLVDAEYTDEHAEIVERWLSAHFYAVVAPRTQMETVKGLIESFEGKAEMGLNRTRYGQQAMLLDYEGGLAIINKQVEAGTGSIKAKILYVGG